MKHLNILLLILFVFISINFAQPQDLEISNPTDTSLNIASLGICKIDYKENRLPKDSLRTKGERLIDNDFSTFIEFPYLIEQPENFISPEIIIDLKQIFNIDSLRINTFSFHPSTRPLKFTSYYGTDSANYTPLAIVENNSEVVYSLSLQNSLPARFLKVSVDSIDETFSTVLSEIEIFSSDAVTSAEVDHGIINFQLLQNYPNPFNPSTKIKFNISQSGNVTLKVFDVLGREVAVLLNEERNAESYEVNFNGSHLSSGIYFYSLTNNSKIITKKMLLLK